jgi:hypothetical protein
VIDVPNLIAGFVLGVIGSLPFWWHDRAKRLAEVGASWTRAALGLEGLVLAPDTRGADLRAATAVLPLDNWRGEISSPGFELLESLQVSFDTTEFLARRHAEATLAFFEARDQPPPHPDIHWLAFLHRTDSAKYLAEDPTRRLEPTIMELRNDEAYEAAELTWERQSRRLHELRVEFVNMARARSRSEYTAVIRLERRRRWRRHPVQSTRAALRNRRARRSRRSASAR